MSIRHEIFAFAVRLVADNTTLIRKPDMFETFLTDIFGQESYDHRIARNLEVESERVLTAAKRVHTNVKFKKIVKHI